VLNTLAQTPIPGNYFENRWVFSRWRNVDNDLSPVHTGDYSRVAENGDCRRIRRL